MGASGKFGRCSIEVLALGSRDRCASHGNRVARSTFPCERWGRCCRWSPGDCLAIKRSAKEHRIHKRAARASGGHAGRRLQAVSSDARHMTRHDSFERVGSATCTMSGGVAEEAQCPQRGGRHLINWDSGLASSDMHEVICLAFLGVQVLSLVVASSPPPL